MEAYSSFYSGWCLQTPYGSNGLLFFINGVCVYASMCVSVCMCVHMSTHECVRLSTSHLLFRVPTEKGQRELK